MSYFVGNVHARQSSFVSHSNQLLSSKVRLRKKTSHEKLNGSIFYWYCCLRSLLPLVLSMLLRYVLITIAAVGDTAAAAGLLGTATFTANDAVIAAEVFSSAACFGCDARSEGTAVVVVVGVSAAVVAARRACAPLVSSLSLLALSALVGAEMVSRFRVS